MSGIRHKGIGDNGRVTANCDYAVSPAFFLKKILDKIPLINIIRTSRGTEVSLFLGRIVSTRNF